MECENGTKQANKVINMKEKQHNYVHSNLGASGQLAGSTERSFITRTFPFGQRAYTSRIGTRCRHLGQVPTVYIQDRYTLYTSRIDIHCIHLGTNMLHTPRIGTQCTHIGQVNAVHNLICILDTARLNIRTRNRMSKIIPDGQGYDQIMIYNASLLCNIFYS